MLIFQGPSGPPGPPVSTASHCSIHDEEGDNIIIIIIKCTFI